MMRMLSWTGWRCKEWRVSATEDAEYRPATFNNKDGTKQAQNKDKEQLKEVYIMCPVAAIEHILLLTRHINGFIKKGIDDKIV